LFWLDSTERLGSCAGQGPKLRFGCALLALQVAEAIRSGLRLPGLHISLHGLTMDQAKTAVKQIRGLHAVTPEAAPRSKGSFGSEFFIYRRKQQRLFKLRRNVMGKRNRKTREILSHELQPFGTRFVFGGKRFVRKQI
jgi:hypothetical protein